MGSTSRARRLRPRVEGGYWHEAKRPLNILAFLLVPIIAYEFGLALVLRSEEGVLTIKAHQWILQFFNVLGVGTRGSLFLGGIVIIVVLFIWHVLNREPWKIKPATLGLMLIESMFLTLPLLVFARVIGSSQAEVVALASQAQQQIAQQGTGAKLAISLGAGLYEELVFRMMLIAALHFFLVDLMKASSNVGTGVAIVVAAAAFAWYHPLGEVGDTQALKIVLFYFAAGLYFGAIYALRGFGIVVAVHAIYDVVTILLME
jgi:hypothetical protein